MSDNPINYQTSDGRDGNDTHRGWYIDLSADMGEMSVSQSRIEANTIAFSTTIPNTEECRASGSGYFMLLDRSNGGRTQFPAFDLNQDNQLNDNDTFDVDQNGKEKAVSASGIFIENGIPGVPSHQNDNTNNIAFYSLPTSDGSIIRVVTSRDQDRRRSWREIRR